jgi:hypothetical protein
MSNAVRDWVRQQVEDLDDWDDGDGFVLATDAGARITSYTGTHGWNSGAGHGPPSIAPVLRLVFDMIERIHQTSRSVRGSNSDVEKRASEFETGPTLNALVAYAEAVERLSPGALHLGQSIVDEENIDD